MIERALRDTIISSLKKYPVVGILGPRQVGKTTLANMIRNNISGESIYLDLELPSDINKLQEAELYLDKSAGILVIIDEIQRMPSLFPLMRALVDKNRIPGRFLILGSASPDLMKHASETLAGRFIYHELTPFSAAETGYAELHRLWLRGGYPGSYLSETDEDSFSWREAFIKTFLERDIPQLNIRIPAAYLRRFWTMLAHLHGQLWNKSRVADSMDVSAPTVQRYLDVLEDTFIIRQLPPYHFNIKKRLIKSPKVYIRDSGLFHTLLMIKSMEYLQGHPTIGSSWEGFVIEQIIPLLPSHWKCYFYRTSAGAEIDLLIVGEDGILIPIEIKYSLSPKPTKGFWNAYQDLSCTKGFVVYPGAEVYPLGSGVLALPIKEISQIIV
ncbi:MAG: ATP-binding protein [Syntrophaceae bacterium]